MPWRNDDLLRGLYPTMAAKQRSSGPGSPRLDLVSPVPTKSIMVLTDAQKTVMRLYSPMPGLESKGGQKC